MYLLWVKMLNSVRKFIILVFLVNLGVFLVFVLVVLVHLEVRYSKEKSKKFTTSKQKEIRKKE